MRVFADTFYWTALTSPSDSAHARAVEFSRSFEPKRIITTDDVLDEFLAHFSGGGPNVRVRAGDDVERLLNHPQVVVLPQSHESFLTGLQLYRARPDKGYSLTDCISMQAMRKEGLTEVLTNDRHFEQEGFRSLFREQ